MQILYLNHNVAFSSGTFFRAFHLGREMARRGHGVTLLSISPTARFQFHEEQREGVRVVETPDWLWGRGRTGWDGWDTLRRVFYVRRGRWDLIHAFDSRPAVILPALTAQRATIPLIMDWADWWGRGGTIEERSTGLVVRSLVGPLETYFEEAFRARATGTTVISAALKQRALELGVRADTILQLPNGSDVDNIRPQNKSTCRAQLGLPEDVPIIGYLGTLLKSDAQLLFDAFGLLLQKRSDCRLLLLGNHNTTVPERQSITEIGYLPRADLLCHLGACDVMLLPLKDTIASRGRWPSKLNDYLAAGKPVVTCEVGEMSTLFAQHEIGIATADQAASFANAVDALLSDRARLDRLGRNARRVAEQVLNWSLLGKMLENHYSNIFSQGKGFFTPSPTS